jgi:hypothetical protein
VCQTDMHLLLFGWSTFCHFAEYIGILVRTLSMRQQHTQLTGWHVEVSVLLPACCRELAPPIVWSKAGPSGERVSTATIVWRPAVLCCAVLYRTRVRQRKQN